MIDHSKTTHFECDCDWEWKIMIDFPPSAVESCLFPFFPLRRARERKGRIEFEELVEAPNCAKPHWRQMVSAKKVWERGTGLGEWERLKWVCVSATFVNVLTKRSNWDLIRGSFEELFCIRRHEVKRQWNGRCETACESWRGTRVFAKTLSRFSFQLWSPMRFHKPWKGDFQPVFNQSEWSFRVCVRRPLTPLRSGYLCVQRETKRYVKVLMQSCESNIWALQEWKELLTPPGIEPGAPDFRSGVLTTTPQGTDTFHVQSCESGWSFKVLTELL